MDRIGIFGGTFDPIHLGHLRGGIEAAEALSLDRVYYIPPNVSPHKSRPDISPANMRLEMVKLAVEGEPLFEALDMEVKREGPSYTVHTIEAMKKIHKDTEIHFIMGIDSFNELTTWFEYEQLFELCNTVVITRPGWDKISIKEALGLDMERRFCYDGDVYVHSNGQKLRFLEFPGLMVSSSEIRRRVREGLSIRYLVHPAVEDYITKNGLYKAAVG